MSRRRPSTRLIDRRPLATLATAALAALSLDSHAFAQIQVAPSAGIVGFDQINEGTSLNAEEGMVTVDVAAALSSLGNPSSGGFLNVADDSGNWLVQNLPVFSLAGPSITTRYDLPDGSNNVPNDHDGTNVTNENLVAVLSTSTLGAAPTGAANNFSLGDAEFDAGGGGDTGDLNGYEPEGQITIQGDLQFNGGKIPILVHYQTQHPNVQAAHNQCAPAATSNSLDYLRTTAGLTIKKNPDNTDRNNVPGLRTQNPNNSLVGNLELQMNRGVTSRTVGNGVWPLDGLLKFASTETGIITRYAVSETATYNTFPGNGGAKLNGTTDYSRYGQTSYAIGSTINFSLIDNLLAQGYALLMDEALGANGANGRHYVQILGDGTVDGKPFIVFSSDLLQTSSDATDTRLGDYFPFRSGTQAGFDSGIEFDWLGGVNGDFLVNHNRIIDQLIAVAVPEPGTISLIGIGAVALVTRRRSR